MGELSPAHRAGTADEVATNGDLLMTTAGAFITGRDLPLDGCVTASSCYGDLAPESTFAIAWTVRGSNPRHPPCKGGALPTELTVLRAPRIPEG